MNLFTPSCSQLPVRVRHSAPRACLSVHPSALLSFSPSLLPSARPRPTGHMSKHQWRDGLDAAGRGRGDEEGERRRRDGRKAHLSLNVAWINRMMADSATHSATTPLHCLRRRPSPPSLSLPPSKGETERDDTSHMCHTSPSPPASIRPTVDALRLSLVGVGSVTVECGIQAVR